MTVCGEIPDQVGNDEGVIAGDQVGNDKGVIAGEDRQST